LLREGFQRSFWHEMLAGLKYASREATDQECERPLFRFAIEKSDSYQSVVSNYV
jgi:hypothetical protein